MKCKASLWTILRSVVLRSKLLMLGLLLAVAGSILFALLPPLVLENIVNTLTFGGSISLRLALLYFGAAAGLRPV